MKLKAIHPLPSVKLAGRVPGELHADLAAYAQYYREALSEPIAVWALVVQMLRTFVDSDREFHAWRRRRLGGATARPDAIQDEVREKGQSSGRESGTAR
jgi:hypothetical protein